ncbi:hypothetical protein QBC46DRAFT_419441 [Diplogelasinospora grovesii]|uniref:Nephrocystin 3-like N-terminal domain-containing protein n=1 Tax=Diplogelasinospora grovesii TaxID=303347 RepID=A0AAN6S0W4_9PEZI|nr:hypothetical protein QBC46DRAFT_419441 [Diplogelasinospora grovesii]
MKKVEDSIAQGVLDICVHSVTERQRERLLQSLRFPAMNERRNHILESYEETRGFETLWDDFGDWLKSDSDIYWISGKPGSGKSTLVKFLIGNPETMARLRIWKPKPVILSHFFWKPGTNMQKNIKGLLSSVLHQALLKEKPAVDSILTRYRDLTDKESHTDWSVRELKSLCLVVLRNYPSAVCLFIDGLDEICEEDGVPDLIGIVNDMKALEGVKVCVASRPEPRLQTRLGNYQNLRLQDFTRDDMRLYASEKLQPSWTPNCGSLEMREHILEELVRRAEGVFLWLHLAVRSIIEGLENGDDGDELEQPLPHLLNGSG